MKLKTYVQIFRTVGLGRIFISFISVFGVLWLLTEPLGLFLANSLNFGWQGYFFLIFFSLLVALVLRFPRRTFSRQMSSPNSTIEVKIGDIFEEEGHLAIGFNDVFDTELGELIAPYSVQGQFLSKIYNNDQGRLDDEIRGELELNHYSGIEDIEKVKGKKYRYPIGTTIVLGDFEARYFLIAYGYMGNDLKIQTNIDNIWQSLSSLWKQVRLKGHGKQITIPIMGSSLARTNLPRKTLAKLIISSFLISSKQEFIAEKMTLIISPQDVQYINIYDLESFLEASIF